jgi:predicted phage terminase large subunit-like protein
MFGLRVGPLPQVVATSTPRPIQLVRELVKDPDCVTVTGTTYENKDNLAPAFYRKIVTKYEGTRLGRQELNAELLEDIPGALWKRSLIEESRVPDTPEIVKLAVAVDPAVTSGEGSAETGIVIIGLGADGQGYVLEDASLRASPDEWAKRTVRAYHFHHADRVVAEVNNGGDLVETVLRTVDPAIPYEAVRASRGKVTRAEPVAALYEQGRVHHVGGFPDLEDQMCTYVPGMESPDRMDALVWGITHLMLGEAFAYAM